VTRTLELKNAIKTLEAFTYTVSHDLKAPIRAIDGYSRIILEDFHESIEEDNVEMILNIRNICKEMIAMINKLLEYSTTAGLLVQKKQLDINEMFENIFNELRTSYLERNIQLKTETKLPKVMADKILLKQAIYNLLANAVKFTRDKEISLIIVGCITEENEYIFYVKDNGVGFDMEFSAKLFGLFQRLHTPEEFEGSGIGLITVQNIIQKHGGRVWIEGQIDIGATVYFSLPF
jgi:light-regulated signal transduction histidine kinase (bacteriophytochrome)